MLNQEIVKDNFVYDPDPADNARPLVRIKKTSSRSNIGDRPGFIDDRGYVTVCIGGRREYMHRAVYCYFNGDDFKAVDHINRNKSDNRIENLRSATNNENGYNSPIRVNNSSGTSGVNWNKKDKSWHVRIRHEGKRIWVGSFKDKEEAVTARKKAVERYHKDFRGE